MDLPSQVQRRLDVYLSTRALVLGGCLGGGTQGTVFLIQNPSRSFSAAVKFHERKVAYDRELRVYQRLQERNVEEVCGHHVPLLIGYDDTALAIEMTTVSPPFCLDFGGAYLDRPPDYSDEVWRDWAEEKSEAFEENWPAVEEILATFRMFGVYIADVNPGNIRFQND